MVLDYDSGSGLFDKLGPVVSLTNYLENWELNAGAGGFENGMAGLEGVLQDDKEFDRLARQSLLAYWTQTKKDLWGLKTLVASISQPLMASEMVPLLGMNNTQLSALCTELSRQMVNDSKDLSPIGYSVTVTNVIDRGASNFYVVVNTTNGFANYLEQNVPTPNELLRILCVNNQPGAETFSVTGRPASSGAGDPNWDQKGSNVNLAASDPVDARLNLIVNGSFENLTNGFPSLWVPQTGALGAELFVNNTVTAWHGLQSIEFAGNAIIAQTLSNVPENTSFSFVFSYMKKTAGTDGNLKVSVVRSSGTVLYSTSIAMGPLGAGTWLTTQVGIGTGIRKDDIRVLIERSGATTSSILVDGIILCQPVVKVEGIGLTILRRNISPLKDDYKTVNLSPLVAGVFATFFNRYLQPLQTLHGVGIVSVSDALAA